MDESTYRAKLLEQGYDEPVLVEVPPNTFLDEHSHDFSSFIYMLAGEITVKTAKGSTTCRAGDTFASQQGTVHSEWTGAEGAKLLSGRKVT
jgi:quercetin dioxygenase-like cupin family protein